MSNPIRIKTFRSKTLQEAIQKIRDEFGPDASILETKAARFGIFGRSRIEVTASTMSHDETVEKIDTESDIDNLSTPRSGRCQHPNAASPESEVKAPEDPSPRSSAANTEATSQSASAPLSRQESVHTQLFKELVDAGIDQPIVAQWINAIRDTVDPNATKDIWSLRSVVRGWIRDLVHSAPSFNLNSSQQQTIAMVGPAGAGKTTTLAKIAANLSMEHDESVGVLSADSYRLGSNYLLQNYADVLGWTFEMADTTDHIADCLNRLSHCRIILVDTRGCSPEDSEGIVELTELIEKVNPTETHLVVPSTCNTRTFLRYERGFEPLSPNRLILTRVDEAGGLGPFFSCLQCSALPVSYLTNGQNIPADLIQATSTRLAQQIMSSVD